MAETEKQPKINNAEKIDIIDDIKKTINQIRQGIRSNIASVWQGFKDFLSNGLNKLFGTPEKPAKTKPADATATDSTKPSDSSPTDSAKPAESNPTTQTETAKPETAAETPKLEESATFKKVMETYAKEIKDPIKNVLYPCSGPMSVSGAFKDSKVTYVDIDENAVNAHKEAGHTAVKEDIGKFIPEEKPDLTLLLNPQAEDEKIKKLLTHVEKDKHIICNNYHSTAELLHQDKSFQLVGVINPDGSKMDKEKPDDYFKEVETDEEFKQNDSIQYDKAVALIKEKKGNAEKDILKQFKELTKDDTSGLHRVPFKKGGDAIGFQTWYYIFKRIKEPEAATEPTENKPKPAQNTSNPTHRAA